jgi:arylformamidase
MDLFPAARPNGQLFLFIHGGYWRFMDKSDFSFIVHPYLRRNISVALINYSLFPRTTMGEVIHQVRNACTWIVANGCSYGIVPRELHLGGWSAGAHLACMAAAKLDTHNAARAIDSVLAISGVFDLRPLLRTSANADLKLDEAEALRNSPVNLTPGPGQRIALLWGGAETEAFRRQSRAFLANWQSKGADIRAEEIAKLHHYAVMDALADEGSRVLKASLALLGCE